MSKKLSRREFIKVTGAAAGALVGGGARDPPQHEAVEAVSNAVRRSRAGLQDLVQALAQYLDALRIADDPARRQGGAPPRSGRPHRSRGQPTSPRPLR